MRIFSLEVFPWPWETWEEEFFYAPDGWNWWPSKRHLSRKRREEVLALTGGVCWLCLSDLSNTQWHVDHVEPWSRGGTHDIRNWLPACPPCNMMKHDALISEILASGVVAQEMAPIAS